MDQTKTEATTDDTAALKDVEKRAKEAEKRVRDLEAADKKRAADDAARAEAAKVRDLDEAKAQMALLAKREAEALARVQEYEAREQARVDAMLEQLGPDAKERLEKYRPKLALADYASLVADEASRAMPMREDAPTPTAATMPFASPGTRVTQGHQLHPKTEEKMTFEADVPEAFEKMAQP